MRHEYTLFRRKGSRVWYFYYYAGNKRISKSTGKTRKYDAETVAQAFLSRDKLKNITLAEYAKDFFIWGQCNWTKRQHAKGKRFSKAVAKNRRAMLKNYILPKWGHMFLNDLNKIEIEDWIIGLKLTGSTKNQLLYTFKTVLKNAELQNVINNNPLGKIERMAMNSKIRDVFTLQELKVLFPEDETEVIYIWKHLKWACCFYVLTTSGIRTGEARALNWSDVIWQGGLTIDKAAKNDGTIGSTKTGKSRVVLLPAKTIEMLTRWRDQSPFNQDEELIFFGAERNKIVSQPYLSMFFRPCLERAGIRVNNRNLVPHSLRHGYNTLMRAVLPEQILRELTGHKTEQMTSLYDHPSLEDRLKRLEESRKLIESVWN